MNNTDQKPLTPTEKMSIVAWLNARANPFRDTSSTVRVRDAAQYEDDPHTIEISQLDSIITPEKIIIVFSTDGPTVITTTAEAVPEWSPTPIREAATTIREQLEALHTILEDIEND